MSDQELNYDHPKCVVCVCGTGGHGKSTLFNRILDLQEADYWFYYDHKSEFSRRFGITPCFDFAGICQSTARGECCFDSSRMYPGKKSEGMTFFFDYVFTFCAENPGRKILVCDELQDCAYQDDPPELTVIMNDGRSHGIDCFFIAQSTNQLHNNVQNQFTEIYTFRQAHEATTKHLVTLGFDKETLLTLPPGEFLWRNLTTGEARRGGTAFKIKSTANDNLFGNREGSPPKANRGKLKNKRSHRK